MLTVRQGCVKMTLLKSIDRLRYLWIIAKKWFIIYVRIFSTSFTFIDLLKLFYKVVWLGMSYS